MALTGPHPSLTYRAAYGVPQAVRRGKYFHVLWRWLTFRTVCGLCRPLSYRPCAGWMHLMKVAYCGYDFFSACLSDLLAHGVDVLAVFTMPCDNRFDYNQSLYELCAQHDLPVTEVPIDAAALARLDADGCELLITAGYPYKVPDLSGTRMRGINVHPTLLPVGRGPWPFPRIILDQFVHSGVTIHCLTEKFDAGNILAQASFPVEARETLESLSAKSQLAAVSLLREVVANFDTYWDDQWCQGGEGSYWPRPTLAERTIDWHAGVDHIDRVCRAFGKSGARARFDEHNWWVYSVSAWPQDHAHKPGAVVHKTNTETIVAAADGLVSLLYFRRILPRPQ